MADRVVIITGASRGIGRAAAVELAHRGCAVSLIARSAPELERTAQLCQRAGSRALVTPADICDEAALADVVARTAEHFGRIDGLLNNAGYAQQASVEETDAALFQKTIAINLAAAMTLSRLAWPHLRAAARASAPDAGSEPSPLRGSVTSSLSGACIVNISSMSAVDPLPGLSAYAAAKSGLLGLTRALAREGQEHNIRSVAIILGAVETEMFRGLRGAGSVPAEHVLAPEEVAIVIAECLTGPLAYSSGEAIYLKKRV